MSEEEWEIVEDNTLSELRQSILERLKEYFLDDTSYIPSSHKQVYEDIKDIINDEFNY